MHYIKKYPSLKIHAKTSIPSGKYRIQFEESRIIYNFLLPSSKMEHDFKHLNPRNISQYIENNTIKRKQSDFLYQPLPFYRFSTDRVFDLNDYHLPCSTRMLTSYTLFYEILDA